MKSTQRLNWIDALKGFGILLMVIGHSKIDAAPKLWIYGFHMPLFFILNGYVFEREKWLAKGFSEFIRSRAKAYLIPYGLMFTGNLAAHSLLLILSGRGLSGSEFLRFVLAGLYSHDTMMPNCAPLWFLTCIFVSCLYFWPLIAIEPLRNLLIIPAYMAFLSLLCGIERHFHITQLPWHIDAAIAAAIFEYCGFAFRQYVDGHTPPQNTSLLIVTVGCSATFFWNGRINMVQNQYGKSLIVFILAASLMCYALMSLFMNLYRQRVLPGWVSHTLEYWGAHTLTFVGFNYLLNTFVHQGLLSLGAESVLVYNIVDVLCVMGCCTAASKAFQTVVEKADERRLIK